MNANLEFKVCGRYRIQLANSSGEIKQDTDWFDNLITNQGLDFYGSLPSNFDGSTFLNVRCAVGTSNTVPAFTDTSLGAQLGPSTGFNAGPTTTFIAGPPDYISGLYTYTFPLGAIVGNIAEVGVGIIIGGSSSIPISVFSHALIQTGGVPTTISVTSSDQLIVTFELRLYLNTTDSSYSVTISSVNYSGTQRVSQYNNTSTYSINTAVSFSNGLGGGSVYNGTIGSITGAPSGLSTTLPNPTAAAYTSGTYFRAFTSASSISQSNVSGGISAIVFSSSLGNNQFSVSPVLPKDGTKTMSLTYNVSWARYP